MMWMLRLQGHSPIDALAHPIVLNEKEKNSAITKNSPAKKKQRYGMV